MEETVVGCPCQETNSANAMLYPIQNSGGLRFFVHCICTIRWHSHLNDMEIPETKSFIPKRFELGTTLSQPNWSMLLDVNRLHGSVAWKPKNAPTETRRQTE